MIEFRGLIKRFGDKEVLSGVTLEVPHGVTTFVIGTSGTGKSVLMKHAVGLLEPDDGEVFVDGEPVDASNLPAIDAIRKKCSYVFQGSALLDSMNLRENVALPLEKHGGLSQADALAEADAFLELVGAKGVGLRFPGEVGGGVRKQAAVARALAMHPKYLILDEPTTSLDPVSARLVDRLIARLAERGRVTSIVVSHDLKSIFGVADRIVFLHRGRVRVVAGREEIRNHPDPVLRGFLEGRAVEETV